MKLKIQSLQSLKRNTGSCRGERKAPADVAQASFESVEAVIRLAHPAKSEVAIHPSRRRRVTGILRTTALPYPPIGRYALLATKGTPAMMSTLSSKEDDL